MSVKFIQICRVFAWFAWHVGVSWVCSRNAKHGLRCVCITEALGKNFMAVQLIVSELFQSGPRLWTNRMTLPSLEPLAWLKNNNCMLIGALDSCYSLLFPQGVWQLRLLTSQHLSIIDRISMFSDVRFFPTFLPPSSLFLTLWMSTLPSLFSSFAPSACRNHFQCLWSVYLCRKTE